MPILRVALALPLFQLFDYLADEATTADVGYRVRVPFGMAGKNGAVREKIGIITAVLDQSEVSAPQLKKAGEILRDLPPLPSDFLNLCEFVAQYYQAPLGEVLLSALPAGLKKVQPISRRAEKKPTLKKGDDRPSFLQPNTEQQTAIDTIAAEKGFLVHLLHGITGSGKTEVYLHLIERIFLKGQQVLLLVPEINLTPQLDERVCHAFPNKKILALHSDLGEAARERHWIAALQGDADLILGTRLSIFTPLPRLGLIIVDEEHDLSFKQQDGVRYSARDLAVFRAHQRDIPVVLGSATPSLESFYNAKRARYRYHRLLERANPAAVLPTIQVCDTRKSVLHEGMDERLLTAIENRLEKGEQSLIFLNRRGYAPVLACIACGWVSHCTRCAAHRVVHLADRRLRCHHCGMETPLPRYCPVCGNQDIQPFGRGTQKVEVVLNQRFPNARVLRVDRDAVKNRRQWLLVLEKIHAGDADILVGTQMLAKGHDFPRLTLVGVLGADAALFAADWRAPERLFSQLMQVSGRAGRADLAGDVILQTQYPDHPLYAALKTHDYTAFAESQLREREQAGFPPYRFHALLVADAPDMQDCLLFLKAAALVSPAEHPDVIVYDPLPMKLSRLANRHRAQLLVESIRRDDLQKFLPLWRNALGEIPRPSALRWHLEVDPLNV